MAERVLDGELEVSNLSTECVMIGMLFHLPSLCFFIYKMGIMILLALYHRVVMNRWHIARESFVNNEEIYPHPCVVTGS